MGRPPTWGIDLAQVSPQEFVPNGLTKLLVVPDGHSHENTFEYTKYRIIKRYTICRICKLYTVNRKYMAF